MASHESHHFHNATPMSQTVDEPSVAQRALEDMPLASKGVLKALQGERFSLLELFGGWRGILESSVPVMVYVVVYLCTKNLTFTLAAALGVGILFLIARLLQKQDLSQAVSGLLGVGFSVAITRVTGRGQDFFAPSIVMAITCALVLLVSIMLRRPLIALLLGWMWKYSELYSPSGLGKRVAPSSADTTHSQGVDIRTHEIRVLWKRCRDLTWLWTSVFLLRIVVLIPLWFSGQIAALGVAKIALGLPLLGIAGWVSWMILRPFSHLGEPDGEPGELSTPAEADQV